MDRILYDYDLTKCDPEKLQHYIQELRHRIGETGTDQFTIEQCSFTWIGETGTDQFTLIRDHFATLDYFAFLFEELWQQEWESLTSHWELQDEIADLNLITAAVVPWDMDPSGSCARTPFSSPASIFCPAL